MMDFQQLLSNESISLSSEYYHSTQNIISNYLLHIVVLTVLKLYNNLNVSNFVY